MLVPHTPRSSFELQRSQHTKGFFSLPLELKEEIYRYFLDDISPASFVVYKHAEASDWSFRRNDAFSIGTPALLLVCKTIRHELLDILYRTSEPPALRINPMFYLNRWMFDTCLYDKADETQCVFELAPVLSTARKIKLEMNLSSDMAEQARILALLRWVVAVFKSRTASQPALEKVEVELTLENPHLWPKEKDSFWLIMNKVPCEDLSVVCVWRRTRSRRWEKKGIAKLSGPRPGLMLDGNERKVEDVEAARKAVVESCLRRHGRGRARKQVEGQTQTSRFWSVSKLW